MRRDKRPAVSSVEVEKQPLTCFDGAEDGIRTRDPHLGKVCEFVHGVSVSPLSWPPVYRMSTESA